MKRVGIVKMLSGAVMAEQQSLQSLGLMLAFLSAWDSLGEGPFHSIPFIHSHLVLTAMAPALSATQEEIQALTITQSLEPKSWAFPKQPANIKSARDWHGSAH